MMRFGLLLAFTLAFTACKKEEEKPAATPAKPADPAATKPADPATKPADPAATKPAEPAADANADYIRVLASHHPKKEGDPVTIQFKTFALTDAKITDVENLEGSTATFEIDLASLDSGIEKRNTHLKTADYLDVGVSPKAIVKVSDVKKGDAADKYTAKADVDAHGVKLSFPVKFEVVEKKPDSVRIKGEHEFKRSDFKIGKAEGAPNETAAENLTLKLQLTIPKK